MTRPAVKRTGLKLVLAICALMHACVQITAQETKIWRAGLFSFSDELGGFRILSVSGPGSHDDPIVIHQEMYSSYSATLVIRSALLKQTPQSFGHVSNGALYMKLVTVNHTNLPWVGFGLELQEILDKPSIYGDGLSFDQLSRNDAAFYSDQFLNFSGEFEPADRLVYTNGWVDALSEVSINFLITDYTPVQKFYLYQDPMIPAS